MAISRDTELLREGSHCFAEKAVFRVNHSTERTVCRHYTICIGVQKIGSTPGAP